MHRRKFLGFAGRIGAGLGIASPWLAASPLSEAPAAGTEGQASAGALAISLDGPWSIAVDAGRVGKEQKWYLAPRPEAKPVRVPSIIQEAFPGYHGVAWYWRSFEAPAHPYAGGRYLLRFDAVDYLSEVWLNGVRLGSHEGGETPFVFDATSAIAAGRSNQLALRVLNPNDERIDGITLKETPHRNKFVKYTNGALPDYGGVIEPVELLLVPAVYITDLHVRPDWQSGKVSLRVSCESSLRQASRVEVQLDVTAVSASQAVLRHKTEAAIQPGSNEFSSEFELPSPRLWDIDDPYFYRLLATLRTPDADGGHVAGTSFGFRDFRVVKGYFRLNGRRLVVKSTHTGNHTPYRMMAPPDGFPDLLRKDLLYAKSSGFNMVRFISGVALPYQLDLCDQLGLMVYEESAGSWLLKDSPQMKTRYEDSMRAMILRDRNHPSVVLWGVLNETEDGPVFREAVQVLPLLRSLDDTRLLLLSSGRFDGHLETGSISNPASSQWEYAWGKEAPGAPQEAMKYPSSPGTGDFHLYPRVPQTAEVDRMIRTLGQGSKPVFLSEYGIGSMMDVIHEARMYEQARIPADAEDYRMVRSMADKFCADWKRFGMETVYPLPETLLHKSQAAMARHRLAGFNDIRSNPRICGFNLTGMLDHAFTGEGIWRFWRDWKPGAFDAMRDGWASVRWCLFVEPNHGYLGRPFTVEAVLANEDAVAPGEYAAHFELWGPQGVSWQRDQAIRILPAAPGQDGPLSIPVLKEQVTLSGPEGRYELVPSIERGIAPPETSWRFHLTDPASFPPASAALRTWGVPGQVESWLRARGATIAPLAESAGGTRELILVGEVGERRSPAPWRSLAESMARGSTVLFLSPGSFRREQQESGWLPLKQKGRIYEFHDWLYHKECVAKPHPVFEGLGGKGLLDWYYYGPVLPSYVFDGQEEAAEVMAAAFAAGYSTPGGYASGMLLASYRFGAGQFLVNSFRILENVDQHPAADRLLLNLIAHAKASLAAPSGPSPADLDSLLKSIGYAD